MVYDLESRRLGCVTASLQLSCKGFELGVKDVSCCTPRELVQWNIGGSLNNPSLCVKAPTIPRPCVERKP